MSESTGRTEGESKRPGTRPGLGSDGRVERPYDGPMTEAPAASTPRERRVSGRIGAIAGEIEATAERTLAQQIVEP